MKFTNKDGSKIVDDVIVAIQKNRDYLSEVDGAIGDGDHGINMNKGFTIAQDELKDKDYNMSEGLKTISSVLVDKIGGSMGPLYGALFRGFSVASKKCEDIDKNVFGEMLKKAYANLTMISPAKVGDKTLIDVLSPAIEAYEKSIETDDFDVALEKMITAAKEGLESTKNMVAKLGRASRLGERSLGHQDAGSTSCYIILESIANSIKELIKQ
ncbi:MAG: dihydroxyacetone kinase subunit L [Tyzzerella sp.]|uniref:phosphoenolpyruvate--glycerone phosphotransferase n=1 Tax=Candidatus Fimicola merdigallinarum TaxID=2840819 RepID=A0A9D9DVY7_9FIRM|nr:dihydroxyacetone kinase subunit L [Candidatus Fimicola merdigallinarum]